MPPGDSLEIPVSRASTVWILLLDAILATSGGWLIYRHVTRPAPAPAPAPPPAPAPAPPPVAAATPDARPLAVKPPPVDAGVPDRPTEPRPIPVAVKPPVVKVTVDAGPKAPLPIPTPPTPPVILPPDAAVPPPPPLPAPPDAALPVEPPTPPTPPQFEEPDAAGPTPESLAERQWVASMTRGIRQVVEDHREVIEDCYRRATRRDAVPVRGRLDIHLRILASGDAEDVRVVENQTGSEELGACLVGVMQSWKYPAPGSDSMDFVWPFTFQGR